ncbi:MAG: hypothetical protein U0X20_03280 [Caldilineaceae bacterium]
MLNQDHCPASCEADVNGTITSLLLQALGDSRVFITDLVSIEGPAPNRSAFRPAQEDSTGTGVFWHCGLAPAAAGRPRRGRARHGAQQPQAAAARRVPAQARSHHPDAFTARQGEYQLALGGGEMLAAPRTYGGTCGTVRFGAPAAAVLDCIMQARTPFQYHLRGL